MTRAYGIYQMYRAGTVFQRDITYVDSVRQEMLANMHLEMDNRR